MRTLFTICRSGGIGWVLGAGTGLFILPRHWFDVLQGAMFGIGLCAFSVGLIGIHFAKKEGRW